MVSGYLIADSWNRDPDLGRYVLRRALRILPALAVAVLLTVGVLGPLLTRLPWAAYFASDETRQYLWNALLAPAFRLPGVFDDGRPLATVNGSLWSIPVEALMYLALPLYGLARARLCRQVLLPLAVVGALAASFYFRAMRPDAIDPVFYWTSLPFALQYSSEFTLAAAVRIWRLERYLSVWAALVLAAGLALLPAPASVAGSLVVVPYGVLALCLAPAPRLRWRSDVSYGVYLYGFPVQQMVISWLGPGVHPLGLTALALAGGYALGWLSWHGVERWALRLKPGGVRRGPAPAGAAAEVLAR